MNEAWSRHQFELIERAGIFFALPDKFHILAEELSFCDGYDPSR